MNIPAEVVLNWHRALNAGEVEEVVGFSDPQIELVGPRGSAFGHGVLRQWLADAGLKLEVTRLYVRQNVVVAAERGVWRSAETGEVVGQAEVATVFRVRGRQVVSLARCDTLEEALAQAGINHRRSVSYMKPDVRLSVLPDLAQLAALHAVAFGSVPNEEDAQMWGRVLARSLCWVTAHEAGWLIGFVNVAWDGGIHAFLLDTAVHPVCGRRGIGTALVGRAATEAARLGAGWLHVDYEPHLEGFYRGCGFGGTRAGLLKLC